MSSCCGLYLVWSQDLIGAWENQRNLSNLQELWEPLEPEELVEIGESQGTVGTSRKKTTSCV